MLNLQAVSASIAANTGQDPRPTRRDDANDPMYNFYRCPDGAWVALGMVIHKEKFWPQVCQALGDPELVLRGWLGMSDEDVQGLLERKVIRRVEAYRGSLANQI